MRLFIDSPEVRAIVRAAFPSYNGNKFIVTEFSGPMRLDSNWEGGSIDYWVILNLETLRGVQIQENGTPFSNGGKIERISELPLNCAVVQHCIFCGKDMGIRIHVGPDNLKKMLPAPVEMTRDQKIVLVATAGLKSFARFDEAHSYTGISRQNYDQAKAELITRGLLKSNGSITDAGRNAVEGVSLWNLKSEQELATA